MFVYHNIFGTQKMFHLKVFNFGTHKRRKFNHCLLCLAISSDLEMTQIWSVSYIYQVCKVHFVFWTLPKVWAIFVLLVSLCCQCYCQCSSIIFGNGRHFCYFGKRMFQNLLKFIFFGVRKLPDHSLNTTFLSIGLQYLILYMNDLILS